MQALNFNSNPLTMTIREVGDTTAERDFLRVPFSIYANDAAWICPLNKDVSEVFDPGVNPAYKNGECTRWVLYNSNNQAIGRIAAFVNKNTAYANPQPTGGVGFFECVENRDAAFLLFDTAKAWLQERGMEAMDGPVNFGERDAWWGLLVEGFRPVPYKMNYNPPYYRDFFESYGFKDYFRQYCFTMHLKDELNPVFHRQHDMVANDPAYRTEHVKKSNLFKYADDFCTIFNRAWEGHNEGRSLEKEAVRRMFSTMKPLIDEELIWFAYHNDQPVAFWVSLPDLNEAIRDFKGKFGWWEKLRVVAKIKFGTFKRFNGFVFGVVPEHQGTGVVGYLIVEGSKVMKASNRYDEYEMQWQGDFNPRMVRIGRALGNKHSRMLITYRLLFDPNKPFERHPVLKSRDQQPA